MAGVCALREGALWKGALYLVIENVLWRHFSEMRMLSTTPELRHSAMSHVTLGLAIESRKNGLRKDGPREKRSLENWSPENWSPENWSPENWSPENWSPEKWSPGNSETKNRGVSVEHRGVCVECSDVINLWKPKTRQQTQNSKTISKLGNKKSWGERRASWRVCGMFGCDEFMKPQNSTKNLPGLL